MKRSFFVLAVIIMAALSIIAGANPASATESAPEQPCRSLNTLDTGFVITDGPVDMGALQFPANAVGPFVVHQETTNNIPQKGDAAYHEAVISGPVSFEVEREGQPNVHQQKATVNHMPSGNFVVNSPTGVSAQFKVWADCTWAPTLEAAISTAIIVCTPGPNGTETFELVSTVSNPHDLVLGEPNVPDGPIENRAFTLTQPYVNNYGESVPMVFSVAAHPGCAEHVELTCQLSPNWVSDDEVIMTPVYSEAGQIEVVDPNWTHNTKVVSQSTDNFTFNKSTADEGTHVISFTAVANGDNVNCSFTTQKDPVRIVTGHPSGDGLDFPLDATTSVGFIIKMMIAVGVIGRGWLAILRKFSGISAS